MKALSLSQPWLWVVLYGGKRIENRKWSPPIKMLGERFALHAARSWDQGAFEDLCDGEYGDIPNLPQTRAEYTFGAIGGTATLRDYLDGTQYDGIDIDTHPGCPADQRRFFFGPYGFLLDDVRPVVTPIPVRGMLGFWDLPSDIAAQLEARAP